LKVKEHYGEYVKLIHGDDGFTVNDGFTIYNRACLEISENCPGSVRDAIVKYYSLGWVKPVAYVHKSELMFNELKGPTEYVNA
jgi:hypothetical protein